MGARTGTLIRRIGRCAAAVLVASPLLAGPPARAVRPGENGRTVYLRANTQGGMDIVVFDGANHFLSTNGAFLDRATWCGHNRVAAVEGGVGIVLVPIGSGYTAGAPVTLVSDPAHADRDPACNATGTQVAFASGNRLFRVPTAGGTGPLQIAMSSQGGDAHEPEWSSDDLNVVFEEGSVGGTSQIEVASADGRGVASGTPVTPNSPGLRHGPSWREDRILYWREDPKNLGQSLGIFAVHNGDLTEEGPLDGTDGVGCKDPGARPEGGFACVGADGQIRVFPGPFILGGTAPAAKPDVERLGPDDGGLLARLVRFVLHLIR